MTESHEIVWHHYSIHTIVPSLLCEPMPTIRDMASLSISIAIKLQWAMNDIKCKLSDITCRQWRRKVTTSNVANSLTKIFVL